MVMQGNAVISPQERQPGQLILPIDVWELGSEMARSQWAWVQTCPDKGEAFLLCRSCRHWLQQGHVCANGLSSPSSTHGHALVWGMHHWASTAQWLSKMSYLEVMWAHVAGGSYAGPVSLCQEETRLSAVTSHAVQMLHSEILMWVLIQPCQTHVIEVRLPNPHLGTY